MKKIIALMLVGTIAAFAVACSSANTNESKSTTTNSSATNTTNANTAAKTPGSSREGEHSEMDNHANMGQHNHSNAK
jgi:hypothetical protein